MADLDDRALLDPTHNRECDIRELTGEIQTYLDRPRPEAHAPEAHEWASRLNEHLVGLHRKVSGHYREQRDARVMKRLAERYPRASRQLEQLEQEREQILHDLKSIVSAAMSYAEAKTPSNPRLRESTRSLLDELARHESASTLLMQELISTDVGGSN